jgi:NTE family protein
MHQDIPQLKLILFQSTNFDELIRTSFQGLLKLLKKEMMNCMHLFCHSIIKGIPEALSKGMYNFNLLSRITRHVRHVRDFNELPPFMHRY